MGKLLAHTLFMLFVLPTAYAGAEQRGDSAVLSGSIADPEDPIISFQRPPFDEYENYDAELDSSGGFHTELPLEKPSYFQFWRGRSSFYLFVRPGDSIHLRVDMSDADKPVVYKGDGRARNQALIRRALLADSLEQGIRASYRSGASRFREKLDSIYRGYKDWVQSIEENEAISERFVRLEKARLRFAKADDLLGYEGYHRYYTKKDSFEVAPSFYDPLASVKIRDPQFRSVLSYPSYALSYFYHIKEQRLEATPSLEDSANTPFLYGILRERVKDDSLQALLLGKLLYKKLLREGASNVGPLLDSLAELPLRERIKDSLRTRYQEWQRLAPGKPAPAFRFPTIDGDTLSLQDLRGQYVYIDVWATWCGPCRREIPHHKELVERFEKKEELAFVSISMDRAVDRWKRMVKEKELMGHQLITNGNGFSSDFAEDYLLRGIPRFILIDPKGRIVDVNVERPSNGAEERLAELF